MCSSQNYSRFKDCIFDAVAEWLTYCDSDPEMGIAIEQTTLDVEICNKEDAHGREWFSFGTLVSDGDVDADAVLDLADQFAMNM